MNLVAMIYSSETNTKIKIMIKCFGKNLSVMKFIEINKIVMKYSKKTNYCFRTNLVVMKYSDTNNKTKLQ